VHVTTTCAVLLGTLLSKVLVLGVVVMTTVVVVMGEVQHQPKLG
jgi:hypothetical protein